MKLFLDTNILVAAVTDDTDRSDQATELLNEFDDTYVSVLSLMELRSVLMKKKQFDRDRIEQIENRITSRATISFLDSSDVMAANRRQSETLLYPMDALFLAAADAVDATLVTFDSEQLNHGAELPKNVL